MIAECHRVLKKAGQHVHYEQYGKHALIDLQCRKLFTIKSRIVWSYDSSAVQAKKTLRLHVRTHPDDGEDAKNYTFNGDAILVEAKTGSQRAVDRLS